MATGIEDDVEQFMDENALTEDAIGEYGQDPVLMSQDIAEAVAMQGYIVVQSSFDPELIYSAMTEVESLPNCIESFKEETIVEYLGHDNRTLAYTLADNEGAECDGIRYLEDSLSSYARSLAAEVGGGSVEPVMIRVPFKSRMDEMMAKALPMDWEDRENRTIQRSLQFIRSRKLCILLILECESGSEIELRPFGQDPMVVDLASNVMLIFDPNKMSFAYRPQGDSLMMQTWILGSSLSEQAENCTIESAPIEDAILVAETGLKDIPIPAGEQTHVTAVKIRGPGNGTSVPLYWQVFIGGVDCATKVPDSRYDMDLYFHDEDELGGLARDHVKSYTKHGAFMSKSQMFDFDHEFFGYSHREAEIMAPSHRIYLEIGYECLSSAGFSRASSTNRDIGLYNGDVGADWHTVTPHWNKWTHNETIDPFGGMIGVNTVCLPARLARFCDLKGPLLTLSTACSSSLVAMSHAHHEIQDEKRDYMIAGINTMLHVFNFIAFSANNMLSKRGRSHTFNDTADGFMRGEGVGVTYLKPTSEIFNPDDRWAQLAGTFTNQDGRSASLTAPHGPSQVKLIKTSLKMSLLKANEVNIAECHGTGTALGDPIEVGAVQTALAPRKVPFFLTSAKSMHGHLEAGAGILGFSKCLLMLRSSVCAANCHMKSINPNLMFDGFPCAITPELADVGINRTCCGVSSFGASGTNGRADVLGECSIGSRALGRRQLANAQFISKPCAMCLGPMCWLCGLARPNSLSEVHQCNAVRPVGADYSICSLCYKGENLYSEELQGDSCPEDSDICISGTWNAWQVPSKMERQEDGSFTHDVILGDTCFEEFKICVDDDVEQSLFPMRARAGPGVKIMGPAAPTGSNTWLIDGRYDFIAPGTIIQITLRWKDGVKTISWSRSGEAEEPSHNHTYSINGSWINWRRREMEVVQSDVHTQVLKASIDIGAFGFESFHFVRDGDANQIIYPAFRPELPKYEEISDLRPEAPYLVGGHMTKESVPVRGPDDNSEGKYFVVTGKYQDVVDVSLEIRRGEIIVKASGRRWSRLWRSGSGWSRRQFYVTGSFNNWTFSRMTPLTSSPGLFAFDLPQQQDWSGGLQIAEDMDCQQMLWPAERDVGSGDALVEGPGEHMLGANANCWRLDWIPGKVRILLDMTATDRRKTVTWSVL